MCTVAAKNMRWSRQKTWHKLFQKTQVAVTEVSASESEKLLHMEERLHERIVGQEEAVSAVASALRRARAELRDMKRPVANFCSWDRLA